MGTPINPTEALRVKVPFRAWLLLNLQAGEPSPIAVRRSLVASSKVGATPPARIHASVLGVGPDRAPRPKDRAISKMKKLPEGSCASGGIGNERGRRLRRPQ